MGADTITTPEGKVIANPIAMRFASPSKKTKIQEQVKAAEVAEDQRIRRLRAIQSPMLTRIGEATTGRRMPTPLEPQGRKTLLGQ